MLKMSSAGALKVNQTLPTSEDIDEASLSGIRSMN